MPTAITTSLFDLLKIGPGPSSSHTIGPMKAGFDFMQRVRALPKAQRQSATTLEVRLFGSLAATGEGHGTRLAVLGGLLGNLPDACRPDALSLLAERDQDSLLDCGDGLLLPCGVDNIIFDAVQHTFEHSNTMIFRLLAHDQSLLERTYFSVGGGFLRWQGWQEPVLEKPPYAYSTMASLKAQLDATGLPLHAIMQANEMALYGLSNETVTAKLDQLIEVMEQSVLLGLKTKGLLPGPIGLHRKAAVMYAQAKQEQFQGAGFLKAINAYALAASEENAAGHCVVTAPTCGSAGVLPAVVCMLKYHMGAHQQDIREGLLAAAAIGFLCKHNASISGAEVGCQGEVGVASAMAAAMLAYARGCPFQIAENAAEIALEHHLGLTCDPVGGFVQIPCIERNAMGAVKAYNAYLIASTLDASYQRVDFDKAVAAMAQTGHDMSHKYKETSEAGLAQSMAEC
jgi:L-serine dehydratase